VGVLGVADDGTVIPAEVPRVVGNRASSDATAIRFQATAQGVANRNFPLNHPKNYFAYPLALYHEDDTDAVLADYVVDAADSARKGAAFLGLVEEWPDRVELSPLGAEVLRFALNRYDSVDDALRAFEDWKGSPKRFCELAPQWGELTQRVMWSYPATQLLVEELQTMHRDRFPNPSLADFVEWLHRHHSTFTVELSLKGTETVRSHVLKESGGLRTEGLKDGNVFYSPTVFQLKAMLFHSGILTERGAEPHRLDPTTDRWALREPLEKFR
jgi:hypothetical protein